MACCVREDACQRSLPMTFGFDGLRHMCAQGWFSLPDLGESERVSASLVWLQGPTWYGWAREKVLVRKRPDRVVGGRRREIQTTFLTARLGLWIVDHGPRTVDRVAMEPWLLVWLCVSGEGTAVRWAVKRSNQAEGSNFALVWRSARVPISATLFNHPCTC